MNKTLILCSALLLCACSKPPLLYRPDLSQGNQYDPKLASQLQLGMSRAQVRALLGAPLLQDPFHPEEDHYIYRNLSGSNGHVDQYSLTVRYDNQGRIIDIQHKP